MRIVEDYRAFINRNGGGKKIATLLLNPNFHSVCFYRLSNFLYRIHLTPIAKIVWYLNRIIFNVDIDYRADLAGGFVLVHGLGTVIGYNVRSKGRLTVYQHVTIGGGNGRPGVVDETGKERTQPLFEDNVVIYTGASVFGGILVKADSVIKAGRIVYKNYPDDEMDKVD